MQTHRFTAVVSENGSLTLEKLPFPAGKAVEVVVFAGDKKNSPERYPLRGLPIQFDDPLSPPDTDWESNS